SSSIPTTCSTLFSYASMSRLLTFFLPPSHFFLFFNDTATPDIYTLSLHDALPIFARQVLAIGDLVECGLDIHQAAFFWLKSRARSEEHTSELQSRENLVCRLLLEKNNTIVLTSSIEASPILSQSISSRSEI